MNSFNEVSLYAIQSAEQKMIQTTSRWEHTQILKHTGNEPQITDMSSITVVFQKSNRLHYSAILNAIIDCLLHKTSFSQ